MDSEEKIFGSLTFRQFIYLAFGSAVIYLAYNYLESQIGIPLSIIVGGVLFVATFVTNKPVQPIDENYLKIKRSHCKNDEEFQRWLRKVTAQVQFQAENRRLKGLSSDPELDRVIKLFENFKASK